MLAGLQGGRGVHLREGPGAKNKPVTAGGGGGRVGKVLPQGWRQQLGFPRPRAALGPKLDYPRSTLNLDQVSHF